MSEDLTEVLEVYYPDCKIYTRYIKPKLYEITISKKMQGKLQNVIKRTLTFTYIWRGLYTFNVNIDEIRKIIDEEFEQ